MSTFIDQNYRYELKFLMNKKTAHLLKYRLSLLMDIDSFSKNEDGSYYIRSLYFDDIFDKAYYEKIDGVEEREKYRIRFYNFDESYIIIEIKGKKGNLGYKEQDRITKEECLFLIDGECDKININNREVLERFINDIKMKHLVPSVIVDYNRLAFTYPIADVRITFDSEIASGKYNYDLFDKDMNLYNILEDNDVILEVKYNDFLPKMICDLVNDVPSVRISMSKFAMCREKKGDIVC